MSELILCRAEKKEVPIELFDKNPGRDSLRLDCNPCRHAIAYKKFQEKRKESRIYIPKSERKTSEVSDSKLYARYY